MKFTQEVKLTQEVRLTQEVKLTQVKLTQKVKLTHLNNSYSLYQALGGAAITLKPTHF